MKVQQAIIVFVVCIVALCSLSTHAFQEGYPTGDRAIIRVRGARSNYLGLAPENMRIEDQPGRGSYYPRGIYSNRPNYYNSGYGPDLGYGSSYRRPIPRGYDDEYGYPSRNIAVTGAFPIPSRYPRFY
ncbi:hypothetical protein GZH46_02487 [Fragariocoptes setiger]|uniref:Prismalin-14 n=1 Tax=Fragariocoptes setiger TaxID=1670756 RepID=A0ABQ7S6G4_9ACAR|nr:hypothetical protein GZH46_02487 [Fragariocoptes setiger]